MKASELLAMKEARGQTVRLDRPAPTVPMAGATKASQEAAKDEGRTRFRDACYMDISRIAPDPGQPRKTFNPATLAALSESIRRRGQKVPILIRWSEADGRYLIVNGERRYRASQMAGLQHMACVIEEETDADVLLELQIIDNSMREDVSPMEQAHAWQRLMQSRGLTLRELGERLGLDHSTVGRALQLTELDPEVQERVEAGALAPAVAAMMAPLDRDDQIAVGRRIEAESLNRDDSAELIREAKRKQSKPGGQGGAARAKPKVDPDLLTSRRFKGDGVKFEATATRKGGFTRDAYAAALEAELARVRGEAAPDA